MMTFDMDQPYIGCHVMITTTMHLLLFHHYVLVESQVNIVESSW